MGVSIQMGVFVQEGLFQGDPRMVKSGQYVSYWNAFLFGHVIACCLTIHNNLFYFFLFQFSFLPPAKEVYARYCFYTCLSVHRRGSLPVWLPGPMFLLGGSLSGEGSLRPGRGWASVQGGLCQGDRPVIDPLYGEGRVLPILLECFLVLSVFSGCKLFDLPCKVKQFCLKVKARLLLEFNLVGGCRFH